MKAVLCTRLGGPDDLELQEIPEPSPGPGEVVVRIAAAALNFFDTLVIAGKYQTRPDLPFSPAAEFAGTVETVGPGVASLQPGERVMGYVPYGCAREKIAVSAERLTPLPPGLPFERAAGLTVTYGTAYHALRDRARLRPGETLAVLGAAGGAGTAAIEVGKLMGARVIACTSSPEKLEYARGHGADATIDYVREDLRERLRALTGNEGVDVIFDTVGAPYTEAALRSNAWQGRHLVIGFAAGEIPKLPLNLVLLKGCDVLGVYWGAWTRRQPDAYRALMAEILAWCADGKVSGHVYRTFPLAETAAAIKTIADRQAMGKVVICP